MLGACDRICVLVELQDGDWLEGCLRMTRKTVRVLTFVISFTFHSKCVCGRHSSQFFLSMLSSMWDLNSPIWGRTRAPSSGNIESFFFF